MQSGEDDSQDRKLFDQDDLPSDEQSFVDDDEDDDEERDEEDQDDDRDAHKRKGAKLKGGKPRKKAKNTRRNHLEDIFDEQASQSEIDEDEEDNLDGEGELKEREAQKMANELYNKTKHSKPSILDDIEDKDEYQIERILKERQYNHHAVQNTCPTADDPCVFQVPVKQGRQEAIVIQLLNKTAKLRNDKDRKPNIISAIALKRRFGGSIFVEVRREKDINKSLQIVKKSLEGFHDVFLGRVMKLEDEDYEKLFKERQNTAISIKKDDYVRVRVGLYKDDLGKVMEVRKKHIDVMLAPRINIQELNNRIKNLQQKYQESPDRDKIISKAFKRLMEYKEPKDTQPQKAPVMQDQFPDIADLSHIKLTKQGNIILSFTADELNPNYGTLGRKQFSYFNKGEDSGLEFMQKELPHLHTTINITRGDEVQIVEGDLKGVVGTIREVRGNIAVIEPRKNLNIDVIEEQVDKLMKRFKEGQHVKIMSGSDKGKTGSIIKIEGKQAVIFTSNQNQIKVLVNNLMIWNGPSAVADEMKEEFKKFDLIKTTINCVGIVLVVQKDTLKILDTNNSIKVISILDFDTKLDTRKNEAKNSYNEIIKNGALVRIIEGIHSGKRCQVKHVYKDYLFLYNIDIYQTSSITVQPVNKCILVTPSSQIRHNRPIQHSNPKFRNDQNDEELNIGKTITIKAGEYKGYQGSIVSNNGTMIGVRLTAKGKVVSVTRQNILAIKKTMEIGKTPRVSASTYAAQSPAPWNESRHQRNVEDY